MSALEKLRALLRLEARGGDAFDAQTPGGSGRLFGGLVAAQALVAAQQTLPVEHNAGGDGDADARTLHSLHAYFLRPGRHALPLHLRVDRIRDGRSFTTRRVVALQRGEEILSLSASFARAEAGISHQEPAPEAPPPETLPDWEQVRAKQLAHADAHAAQRRGDATHDTRATQTRDDATHRNAHATQTCDDARHREARQSAHVKAQPIEVRSCDPDALGGEVLPPRKRIWLRPALRAGAPALSAREQAALLVYASDRTLLSTAARPHGIPWRERSVASLDHALWIHRTPPRFDDWLLYVSQSPVAHAARGLVLGALYNRAGERIASVAQEGLIRRTRARQN